MGHKATLTKARQELEDLYSGVLDDSVDLTFKDMLSYQENVVAEKKINNNLMSKSPSLDFSVALNETKEEEERRRSIQDERYNREQAVRSSAKKKTNTNGLIPLKIETKHDYDDVSVFSAVSELGEGDRRKRPGIPHSNICTLCSEYIYIFRHRCLVCGRVYCKNCVSMGMGEMSEGRKCIQCLGRRFSQRYIERAGHTGCCCWSYSSILKQQELIWAEKGPRRSNGRNGKGCLTPISGSSIPGTPIRMRHAADNNNSAASFSAGSKLPLSPHNFPL